MSQQGERSTGHEGHEDDWWGQLYDDSTEDTGPTAAGDSLDDRFASASGTVDASPADAVFGRVNPNWTAPLFPQLALIAAWAVMSVRPKWAWLRWLLNVVAALHIPLGLALMLFAYVSIDTRTVPFLGPVKAFDFVYGWNDLWDKVSALAKENDAQWVDTTNYSLNGWLGYYARIAHDPLPVFETSEPFRYQYMPPRDPTLMAAPHLLVAPGTPPPPPNGALLSTITRDDKGEALETYSVFLVK
jgi:hypothetical protein